ncbi:helix-turn-helix domain-containing protein [Peribacillus sp. NPDC097206]|uniref:helix-turn-helix domain-containing protein n=1 Tax=Peribacillus sp. NPDC097206 TaxID=3364398 RepID=UPI0038219CE9
MIGLEYIVKEFHMSFTDVANLLGITRKSITNWTKGWQPIPKKHLGKLSAHFGIKEEYFQKELNEAQRLEVQIAKLEREDSGNHLIVDLMNDKRKKIDLLNHLDVLVESNPENYDILHEVGIMLEQKNELLEMFLISLKDHLGGRPYMFFENEQLGKEMFYLFKKYGIVTGDLDE